MKRFLVFVALAIALGGFAMAENSVSLESGYALSSGSGQLVPTGDAFGTVVYAQAQTKTQLIENGYLLADTVGFTGLGDLSPVFRADLGLSGYLGKIELGAVVGASLNTVFRFDGFKFFGRYQFTW